MKEYSMLLKWLLKINFKSDLDKKKKKKRLAMIFAFAVGFLPLLVMTVLGLYFVTPQIIQLGIFKDFLKTLLGVTQFVIFFFGIMSIMSYMYFSKDNEFLSSLPVNGRTVFMAKLTKVYIDELFVSFFSILPTLTAIGISAINAGYKLTALYFVLIPFAALLMPMIPLFVISVISTPIMYVISYLKNRSALAGLASILLFMSVMGIYLGFMNSFAYSQEGNNSNMIIVTQQMADSIVGSSKFFTFNKFFVDLMLFENVFINLIAFIGMLGILMIGAVMITSRLYNKAVRSQLENKALLKNKGQIEGLKSHSDAILKKDLKSIIRDTGMAFNTFMGPLLTPILIIFIASNMFKGSQNDDGMMKGYELFFGISFIFYYSILILCSTNYSSIIAFSREGEQFIINKYLPLDYKVLVKGKAKLANLLSAVGITLTSIATFVALAISGIKINFLAIINVTLLATNLLIFSVGFNYFGIYRDLKKPKVNWQTTNEVVKKNGNAMVSMFICMGMGLAVLMYSILLIGLKLSPVVLWPVFWSVTIIASIVLLIIFKNKLENSCVDLIENFEG